MREFKLDNLDGPVRDCVVDGIGISGYDSPVLTYLLTIAPTAIDVEFRTLYQYDGDEEGLVLLGYMLQSFANNMQSGQYFEVLQAYVHRFLMIYVEDIMKHEELHTQLQSLKVIHGLYVEKFKHVLHSNLCLLKLMTKMPTM